jgi:allophanate hydrolase
MLCTGRCRALISEPCPSLCHRPRQCPQTKPAKSATIAVVGAHLSGQPLNGQLVERHAKLVETTRTGSGYRLHALANASPPKPGLVFDGTGGGAIDGEIWEMDE